MGSLVRTAVSTVLCLAAAGASVHAQDARRAVVRSHATALVAAIDEGRTRSATFRRLVARIEQAKGIVSVDPGTCQHRARSCLLLHVIAAGDYRMLFVQVDPRLDPATLIPAIGDELQHAVEVLANQYVRRDATLYLHYAREGQQPRKGLFETEAAKRTTVAVREELQQDASGSRVPERAPELDAITALRNGR